MTTFVIQAQNDNGYLLPFHDFSWTLLESIRYNNWFYDEERYRYVLLENNQPFHVEEKYNYLQPGYIPVGSVEFVKRFITQFKPDCAVWPLNIPVELLDYKFTGRNLMIVKTETGEIICSTDRNDTSLLNQQKEVFVKSCDEIKGYAEIITPDKLPKNGTYLLSELIDIAAEWRGFVYNGELLDIRSYSGAVGIFPNIQKVREMVKTYKSAPPAYTIDVAVLKDGNTVILECHNFFSCGLYGFADHKNLPVMLIKAFRWQTEGRNR